MIDEDFIPNTGGLNLGFELISFHKPHGSAISLPLALPSEGLGPKGALELLAPHVLGRAAQLDSWSSFAHMDPPTPWVTWVLTQWNARLNQNLLHPATAPFAREAERLAIQWLAPYFGMSGGHMTAGSTLANITAIWAARECVGVKRVVASSAAHVSVRKAAHLLGLHFHEIGVDEKQRLDRGDLPQKMSDACLVLTAGSTSSGAVDDLELCGQAAWTHVDAAWAGPLRLSQRHASILDGIAGANSVAISAHKWLFQPKEAGLVLFRDAEEAEQALSFGGTYLTAANVGILGSRAAAAIPLLGTLLSWGRAGLASRLDHCMEQATSLADGLLQSDAFELFEMPQAGVVVFRSKYYDPHEMLAHMIPGVASSTIIDGQPWLRCVSSNPNADVGAIIAHLCALHPETK